MIKPDEMPINFDELTRVAYGVVSRKAVYHDETEKAQQRAGQGKTPPGQGGHGPEAGGDGRSPGR